MDLQSLEGCENKPISVGPWGGQGGRQWDDGADCTLRQLVIAHGSAIDSVQIEYDKKGGPVWSQKHGGNGGSKTDKVKLDYPDEFLTSVHGTYGVFKARGAVCVRSLTFRSNKNVYGPFGTESGTCFSLPITGGKIVGFHGKSGSYLDAIGVYLRPLQKQNNSKISVSSQFNVPNGNEKLGYSVMQGSVGENYDIFLAVRQKDTVQSDGYGEARDVGPMNKVLTNEKVRTKVEATMKIESPEKVVPIKIDAPTKVVPLKIDAPAKAVPAKIDVPTNFVPKQIEAPMKVEGVISYGPWGGTGGAKFDDGIFTGIRQINLSRNMGIVSIKVWYDIDGKSVWGSKHGGTGGFKNEKIVFDFPSEKLTHITGTYGSLMYMGPNVIRSLTFHTNKGKHGPFGEEQGTFFSNKIGEGKIVGFHGKEGLFLDSIGFHVKEGKVAPAEPSPYTVMIPHKSNVSQMDSSKWSNKLVLAKKGPIEEIACGFGRESAPYGPGPWGGDEGKSWDDGVFSGIKQIFVTRGDAICSIQIEYDRNGQSVWSIKHGGNAGVTTNRVKLDYPNEVLTCISGYYGPVTQDERSKAVKSLTFYTSRGKYGPFGEEIGTFFTSTTKDGKVVGFHGRSSSYLDAIGVHIWLETPKTNKFKFF